MSDVLALSQALFDSYFLNFSPEKGGLSGLLDYGIADGPLGLLLTAITGMHNRPEPLWEESAGRLAKGIVQTLNQNGLPSGFGLMVGLAGYPFVFRLAGVPTMLKVADQLDDFLYKRLDTLLQKAPLPLATPAFDVIYGFAGTARYLLDRAPEDTRAEALLRRILELFVRASIDPLKGFFAPSDFAVLDASEADTDEPKHFSMGMSHGIPGVLMLLALAFQKGIHVQGQKEAMVSLGQCIEQSLYLGPYGLDVPSMLALPSGEAEETEVAKRAGWCYGIPGVALPMWVAGEAIGSESLRQVARNLTESLANRTFDQLMLSHAGLCHGYAGTMHIWRYLKGILGIADNRREHELIGAILKSHRPDLAFGFASPFAEKAATGDPSFLEGGAGIVLAWMSFEENLVGLPWDQVLMLS
ncbi:MAG: lanthionine synthetase C family protein [Deinococcaceae bacterium]